jgi:hypothetical protein
MRKHRVAWASMAVALIALVAAISGVAAAAPSSSPKAHAASSRGPRGPRGFTGPRGPRGFTGLQGLQGPPGVVPQIVTVTSPHETLNPGQTTYEVDPNGFQATCPSGYTVIGTGYNGSAGLTAFVLDFGPFVGGLVANDTNIQLPGVYVQAICAVVPGGNTGSYAADRPSLASSEAAYHAQLKREAATR